MPPPRPFPTCRDNPFIRSILCQNSSTLDLRRIMDGGKVVIVNLAKGRLGAEPSHLLGAMLISGFAQAAEARRDTPEDQRRDFTLYIDEFQNFATDSLATILSEARKWRLSLVAANQHVAQLSEPLRHAVFGNTGTLVCFRVGAQDAELLSAELGLSNPKALRETSNFQAWLRLMHDNTPREPRLIHMLRPPASGVQLTRVTAASRARYMRPRATIEAQIEAVFTLPPRRKPRPRTRRNPDR
jgi:TraM recognition site of TraD and TraG